MPLELSLYLQSESSLAVWTAALAHLHTWREILGETSARQGLDSLVLSLLSQQYASLGWTDSGSHLDKLLRQRVLGAMVQAGRREAVDKARGLFRNLMAGNGTVAANLQGLVYGVGVREGGREEWRWCWERYLATNVPSERSSLLKALGETRDVFIIQDFLEMTLDQSKVRGQDVQSVLAAVAANPAGNTVHYTLFKAQLTLDSLDTCVQFFRTRNPACLAPPPAPLGDNLLDVPRRQLHHGPHHQGRHGSLLHLLRLWPGPRSSPAFPLQTKSFPSLSKFAQIYHLIGERLLQGAESGGWQARP